MTKFPPPIEKFPKISVSQIDSFCGYTRHKKSYKTSLQAYIANVNDVEESLRPILESRQINTWLPDQILYSSYV